MHRNIEKESCPYARDSFFDLSIKRIRRLIMSDIHYVTAEGLEKLKAELAEAISQRPVISKQIAEARDKRDLSENAEYDAAKEAQGLLELKISKRENLVANARVIDESKINTDHVQMLTKVTLKNLLNNTTVQYSLVGES